MPDDDFTTLVEGLYERIGSDTLWPFVLEHFARLTKASYAVLGMFHTSPFIANFEYVVGMDESDRRKFNTHYAKDEPFMKRLVSVGAGQTLMSHAHCPNHVLERTEVYNDFMLPLRLHYGLAGVLVSSERSYGAIGALRDKRLGPCDSEVDALGELMPHLQRAARLHFELAAARAGVQALSGALDQFRNGVFLLDRRGCVMAMNRQARSLVQRNDGLRLGYNGLTALLSNDSRELQRHVAAATEKYLGGTRDVHGWMLISRSSGRASYRVFVSPAPPTLSEAAVLVFVSDPDQMPRNQVDALGRMFGLTAAEIRLVAAFERMKSLEKAAKSLGVSVNTAKTQLKAVYAKTGVRSGAELIQIIYTMPDLVEST